ncbi:MAG: hypothetical protein HC924_17820 [Synechococcaceae cyanobacterium SM2_3_2]|nr:hypothetical protein [Synechococcaceae cyanobacterium SM2_3_2]
MTQTEDQFGQILTAIEGIRHDVAVTNERLTLALSEQGQRWAAQETENRVILERIDIYQKSSNQVVNLAFALIGAATVAAIGIVLRIAVSL